MKKLLAIILCLVCALNFAACASNQGEVEEQKLDVQFELNTEKSVNAKVCVNTNLPEGTKLDVDIFVGEDYHSTETVVVVGDMASNYFITESQYDVNGEFIADGTYILSVVLCDPSLQPISVQEIIGSSGEKMTGTFVYQDEITGGKTAKFSKPLTKENNAFFISEN